MSTISNAILETLLDTITDYELVELTDKQMEELNTICDKWEDKESIESEINRFLIKENYVYNEFCWTTKKTAVTENNKLIAKFMYPDFVHPIDMNDNATDLLKTVDGSYYTLAQLLAKDYKHLNYHKSWDKLMQVIEKIDHFGASVIIGRMFCDIKYTDPLDQEKHFDVRIASGVKINAVNGAVLDFIQWYNEHKK